VTAQSL